MDSVKQTDLQQSQGPWEHSQIHKYKAKECWRTLCRECGKSGRGIVHLRPLSSVPGLQDHSRLFKEFGHVWKTLENTSGCFLAVARVLTLPHHSDLPFLEGQALTPLVPFPSYPRLQSRVCVKRGRNAGALTNTDTSRLLTFHPRTSPGRPPELRDTPGAPWRACLLWAFLSTKHLPLLFNWSPSPSLNALLSDFQTRKTNLKRGRWKNVKGKFTFFVIFLGLVKLSGVGASSFRKALRWL